jgi:phytoene dehydrogenase-like protein
MRYLETSACDTIDGMFTDPVLRKVLTGTSLLYAGDRDKTTLYHYGMINHSFIESAYRFIGGSQHLADALTTQIRAHGGEVLTDRKVTSIRVCDTRASGVETDNEEFFEARYIISDIHPALTFEMVRQTPLIKDAHRTRFSTLKNSQGMFCVYLVMKPGTMPYLNRNFYIHASPSILLSMQADYLAQKSAGVVSLLCPVSFEMFERWSDTLPERRGADYLDVKARLAERIIELAERQFDGLRKNAEHIYTTSPLSYRDYTATPEGSAYGIIKDWRSPLTTLIPVNTRLENLLMTGQNLNIHGALGVTATAARTVARLVGEEYLAKKIGNA